MRPEAYTIWIVFFNKNIASAKLGRRLGGDQNKRGPETSAVQLCNKSSSAFEKVEIPTLVGTSVRILSDTIIRLASKPT